ncbi:MAG: DUF4129 domain-containing protein [Acidimicrobiales bacterium]
MDEHRPPGRGSHGRALVAGGALFLALAAVVLAASTGSSDGSSVRVRPPSLSLLVGLVATGVLAAGLFVLLSLLRTLERGELRDRHHTVRDLIRLAVIFVLLVVLFRLLPEDQPGGGSTAPGDGTQGAEPLDSVASGDDWLTLALIAGVAAILGWRSWRNRRGGDPIDAGLATPLAGAVADVLDDVIDRLRREPDARRAVIAAYARMEDVFARYGQPRRASEAPIEFLTRALERVTDPAPAGRLTDLFQRAMFSTQPFDRARQDEAIDALVAVRDDLRARAMAAPAP